MNERMEVLHKTHLTICCTRFGGKRYSSGGGLGRSCADQVEGGVVFAEGEADAETAAALAGEAACVTGAEGM